MTIIINVDDLHQEQVGFPKKASKPLWLICIAFMSEVMTELASGLLLYLFRSICTHPYIFYRRVN